MNAVKQSRLGGLISKILSIIETVVFIAIITMVVITTAFMLRDILEIITSPRATLEELRIIVDYVLLLFIFSEILRTLLLSKREGYLVTLVETAVVVIIREIFASAIAGVTMDLLLSTLALIIAIIALWIARIKIFR